MRVNTNVEAEQHLQNGSWMLVMEPLQMNQDASNCLFTSNALSVTTYEQKEDKLPVLVFGTEQVNL